MFIVESVVVDKHKVLMWVFAWVDAVTDIVSNYCNIAKFTYYEIFKNWVFLPTLQFIIYYLLILITWHVWILMNFFFFFIHNILTVTKISKGYSVIHPIALHF